MRALGNLRVLGNDIRLPKTLICLAIIIFSVVSFSYNGVIRAIDLDSAPGNQSVDFYQFYTIGRIWRDGENAYDYSLYRRRFSQIAGEKADAFQSGDYYPPQ